MLGWDLVGPGLAFCLGWVDIGLGSGWSWIGVGLALAWGWVDLGLELRWPWVWVGLAFGCVGPDSFGLLMGWVGLAMVWDGGRLDIVFFCGGGPGLAFFFGGGERGVVFYIFFLFKLHVCFPL